VKVESRRWRSLTSPQVLRSRSAVDYREGEKRGESPGEESERNGVGVEDGGEQDGDGFVDSDNSFVESTSSSDPAHTSSGSEVEVVEEGMVDSDDDDDRNDDFCFRCQRGGNLLCCESCTRSFHPDHHDPPISAEELKFLGDSWACCFCSNSPIHSSEHCFTCGGAGEIAKPLMPCKSCLRSYHPGCSSLPYSEELPNTRCESCVFREILHVESIRASRIIKDRDAKDVEVLLLKLEGKGHRHNLWVPFSVVSSMYPRKIQAYRGPRRIPYSGSVPEIPPEWLKVHKVIAFRKHPSEYLVKWRNLPYSEVSWDSAKFVKENFPACILQYEESLRVVETNRPSTRPKGLIDFHQKTPYLVEGMSLFDYQLEGLNWMRFGWSTRQNGILADEMGLGKTIQAVAFVASLHDAGWTHPFLIVAPLSTLENWEREFSLWAPQLRTLLFHGSAESRKIIARYELGAKRGRIHVIITSYETIMVDARSDNIISKLQPFQSLVVDEGHRLKAGNESVLVRSLSKVKASHKVLLTGTPLQTNLQELHALLNFLNPIAFHKNGSFEALSTSEDVQLLRERLQPFILRRTKWDVKLDLPPRVEVEVPVPLSNIQVDCYAAILDKSFSVLTHSRRSGARNVLMELRKCCNHAFLVSDIGMGVAEYPRLKLLISASGKLSILDGMLQRLKDEGHRVLIFSQFVLMLDLLAEFAELRGYKFEMLHGGMRGNERQSSIDRFNSVNSDIFLFLLSTRAGGLGINLATADTVVIFDSDFNPQMDLQALARAHRIGQTSKLVVYRFVTYGTVEEKILERAKHRKQLTDMVVGEKVDLDDQDLATLVRHGAENIIQEAEKQKSLSKEEREKEGNIMFDASGIERLLDREKLLSSVPAAGDKPNQGEIFQAFNVRELWNRKLADSIAEPTPKNNIDDVQFWKTLLEERLWRGEQERTAAMGRGMRDRKSINYKEVQASRTQGALESDDDGRPRPDNDVPWRPTEILAEEESDDEIEEPDQSTPKRPQPSQSRQGSAPPDVLVVLNKKHREEIIRLAKRSGFSDYRAGHIYRGLHEAFPRTSFSEADLEDYLTKLAHALAEYDLEPDYSTMFRNGLPRDGFRTKAAMRDMVVRISHACIIHRKCTTMKNVDAGLFEIRDAGLSGIQEQWYRAIVGKDNRYRIRWDKRRSDLLLLFQLSKGKDISALLKSEEIVPSWVEREANDRYEVERRVVAETIKHSKHPPPQPPQGAENNQTHARGLLIEESSSSHNPDKTVQSAPPERPQPKSTPKIRTPPIKERFVYNFISDHLRDRVMRLTYALTIETSLEEDWLADMDTCFSQVPSADLGDEVKPAAQTHGAALEIASVGDSIAEVIKMDDDGNGQQAT